MKTIMTCSLLFLLMLMILTGCQNKESMLGPNQQDAKNLSQNGPMLHTSTYPIYVNQNQSIGTLTVANDATNLHVTYTLVNGWKLKKTHLHLATTLSGIPQNDAGVAQFGKFDFRTVHLPMVTEFSYMIPLANYDADFGDSLFIAANASVFGDLHPENANHHEDAWAGNIPGGGPQWWYYAVYHVEDLVPVYHTEPAMVRMYDNPFDFTYRWSGHPWFSYIVTAPIAPEQTYYLYARERDKVGTVVLHREDDFIKLSILLMPPYYMKESHVNVQLHEYWGIPDFKMFLFSQLHDPRITEFSYYIPWNVKWEGQKLFISMHAEVGPF